MHIKNLLLVSSIALVSACGLQQTPAPYVDRGDTVYGRGNTNSPDFSSKDSFKEVPNPSLESSASAPVKGSTLDYIDGNENGRARVSSSKISAPPVEQAPEKKVEASVLPAKKIEEKPVNQMSALDNIKPKPKPKLKNAEKKEKEEAKTEKEEKPAKQAKAEKAEVKAAKEEPEEKSPVEEISGSGKEADLKEENNVVIKLPAKVEEKKPAAKAAAPVAEKPAAKKIEEPVAEKAEVKEEPEAEKSTSEKQVKVASGKFMKPVDGPIIKKFGEKNGATTNDGINIQAAEGTPVQAAGDGSVVYSGNQLQGYGNLIIIRHSNGYLTAYAHLKDLGLKKGDEVKQGDVIGHVGKTGNADQPQLHFGVRKGRDPVDPEKFL